MVNEDTGVPELTEIQEIQLLGTRCKELSELAAKRCSEYENLAYEIEQTPELLDSEKKAEYLEELIEMMTDVLKEKEDIEDELDGVDESYSDEEEERATDLVYKDKFNDGTFNDHPFHDSNFVEYVPATLPIHMYKKLKELCDGDVAHARGYIEYIMPEIDDDEIKERLLSDLREDGAFDDDDAGDSAENRTVDETAGIENPNGGDQRESEEKSSGNGRENPSEEKGEGDEEKKDDLPDHLKPKEENPEDGRDLTKYKSEAIKRCEDLAETARSAESNWLTW